MKITLKDGTLMFLPEDYMPNLTRLIEDTLGSAVASLVEDWANDAAPDAVRFAEMSRELRELRVYNEQLQAKLDRERDEHTAEIGELEEELTRLNDLKDLLWTTNERLMLILKSFGWSGFRDDDGTEDPQPRVCANCVNGTPVDGSFGGGVTRCGLNGSYHYEEQEGCGDFAARN